MLSQALKGSSSSSSFATSVGLASQLSHTTSVLAYSLPGSHTPIEAQLRQSADEDVVESPNHGDEDPLWASQPEEEDAQQSSPFLHSSSGLDELCRSFMAASSIAQRPPLGNIGSSSSSTGVVEISGASTSHNSSGQFAGIMARSCPKPIVMPRRSRQGSFSTNQDELTVFIPPHELAASSLVDPTNVADSLCRKGTAAIRLRAGVLRRTGYLEGHTETLKPQTSATSFRQ